VKKCSVFEDGPSFFFRGRRRGRARQFSKKLLHTKNDRKRTSCSEAKRKKKLASVSYYLSSTFDVKQFLARHKNHTTK